MMTASTLTTHIAMGELLPSAPATLTDDACADCGGTLVVLDTDGSLTGFSGAVVPCACTFAEHGESGGCGCHLDGWPLDGGFTGWLPSFPPLSPDDEDGPAFTPCPVHAPARTAADPLEVAA